MATVKAQMMQMRQENAELRRALDDAKRTIAQQDKHMEACAEQIENLLGSLSEAAQYRLLYTELATWSLSVYGELVDYMDGGKTDFNEILSSAPDVVKGGERW